MKKNNWTKRVLRRGEGQLWFVGLLLWALLIAEVIASYLASPTVGRGLVFGIVAEIFTGREGGIPIALEAGVPRLIVMQVSLTQDIASALVVYPVFLYALHRWHDADNYLMRRVRAIESHAERHQAYVHRWGPLGIGLFMLVPFAVNGPMLGLVIGRLAGIRTRYVLPAVVAATAIAAAAWTFFFDTMIRLAGRFDGRAGAFIAALMVIIIVELAVFDYFRERKARRLRRTQAAQRAQLASTRPHEDE